jgi:HEAT repeat protein
MAILGWSLAAALLLPQVVAEDEETRAQVDGLVAQLKEQVATRRSLAAIALGDLGARAKAAVPALVESLGDQDRQVSYRAIVALGKIGPDAAEAIPALMDLVEQPTDSVDGDDARAALARIGAAAVPPLLEALERNPAFGAVLAQVGKPAVPALLEALGAPDADHRRAAASVLGMIGPDASEAVSDLSARLEDEDPRVGAQAARALGLIGVEDAVPALLAALDAVGVRGQAIVALGRLGPSAGAAVPKLIAFQADRQVAAPAGQALVRIGPDALAAATRGLTGEDKAMRGCSARALTWFGAEAAVPPLVEILRTGDADLRAIAAEALDMLGKTAKQASASLVHALQDSNPYVQAHAESSLEKLVVVDPTIVPALLTLLSHESRSQRVYAAVILSRLGNRGVEAVPVLVDALGLQDVPIRLRVLRALGDIGTAAEAALPALEAAERDREREVRSLASKTLKSVRITR